MTSSTDSFISFTLLMAAPTTLPPARPAPEGGDPAALDVEEEVLLLPDVSLYFAPDACVGCGSLSVTTR